MENVAALVSSKFIKLFNEWQLTLERYGYTNFAQVLNAKTHGYPAPVPQNRERIFMVSILDCSDQFCFPEAQTLKIRLKDILEQNVDEKYYLSSDVIENFIEHKERNAKAGNGFGWNPTNGWGYALALNSGDLRANSNYIKE